LLAVAFGDSEPAPIRRLALMDACVVASVSAILSSSFSSPHDAPVATGVVDLEEWGVAALYGMSRGNLRIRSPARAASAEEVLRRVAEKRGGVRREMSWSEWSAPSVSRATVKTGWFTDDRSKKKPMANERVHHVTVATQRAVRSGRLGTVNVDSVIITKDLNHPDHSIRPTSVKRERCAEKKYRKNKLYIIISYITLWFSIYRKTLEG
jgi:hypothetical protein